MSDIKDIKGRFREEFIRGGREKPSDGKAESPIIIRDVNTNGGAIIIGNTGTVNLATYNIVVIVRGDGRDLDPAPVSVRFASCDGGSSPAVQRTLDALDQDRPIRIGGTASRSAKTPTENGPITLDPAQSVPNQVRASHGDERPPTPQFALMSAALAQIKARQGRCQSDHHPTVSPFTRRNGTTSR